MFRWLIGLFLAFWLAIATSIVWFIHQEEEESWLSRQLDAATRARELASSFVSSTHTALYLADRLYGQDPALDPSFLLETTGDYLKFQEIVIMDQGGTVLASAALDRSLLANAFTARQSAWFVTTAKGEDYVGSIEVSPSLEPYLIEAVFTDAGHIVVGRMDAHLLWDMIDTLRFGETGSAYILNAAGTVIAHSEEETALSRTRMAEVLQWDTLAGTPSEARPVMYVNPAGDKVLGVAVVVPESDWLIVTEVTDAEVFATSRLAMLIVPFASMLIVLGSWALTIRLLDRLFFKPLDWLHDGAQRLGSGDLSHRIPAFRGEEINDVGRAFNRMASKLQARNTQLVEEIAERKRMSEQLAHDAFHDSLTALPNRALFLDRLNQAARMNRRNAEYKFAVLFLDLDRFKIINDSLGHRRGDEMLIEAARRLKSCVREVDTIARMGGDEFAILLEDIGSLRAVTQVAERIKQALGQPMLLGDHSHVTSVSIGIVLSSENHRNPEDYLRDADTAMYSAKAREGGDYEIFDKTMREQVLARMALEANLRSAITEGELRLHYQPIVDLSTGEVAAFESLLRWEASDGKVVPARELISVAEEAGLIIPIGRWVVREAVAQIAAWNRQFPSAHPLKVSVNLSVAELRAPDLLTHIEQTLLTAGVSPDQLSVEVTENAIIDDVERTSVILRRLSAMGLEVHLDDFGTGYSSLSQLSHLPFDVVKLDRSFVAQLADGGKARQLVKAILLMIREMGLKSIAEGVETEAQLALLRDLGCDYAQGYLIASPGENATVEALLKRERTLRLDTIA